MKKYFIITDLEKQQDCLWWQYDNTDILGIIVAFSKKQETQLDKIRVYICKDKKTWGEYGIKNFHRIKVWLN